MQSEIICSCGREWDFRGIMGVAPGLYPSTTSPAKSMQLSEVHRSQSLQLLKASPR